MTGQLDQISEAIGFLRSEMRSIREHVQSIETKVDALAEDLSIDKADLAKLRNKGIGILTGIGAVAGFAGAKTGAIIAALGKLSG